MNEAYEIISAFIELTETDLEADDPNTDLYRAIARAREWLDEPAPSRTTYGQMFTGRRD